jgi:hypothetical protein
MWHQSKRTKELRDGLLISDSQWARDPEYKIPEETPEVEYTFIGQPSKETSEKKNNYSFANKVKSIYDRLRYLK